MPDLLSLPILLAAALSMTRRSAAGWVLAAALLPMLLPDPPEAQPMLWQTRWLGLSAGVGAIAVALGRGARPFLALGVTWLLVRGAAPLWPAAFGLVAPVAVWGTPALALLGLVARPATAVALGATAICLAGALTQTTPGVAWGAAALAGGTLAASLQADAPRRAGLALALLGPATWGVVTTLHSTVPAHPLPAVLLTVVLVAVTVRHARTSSPDAPRRGAWALVALIPLAALVPNDAPAQRLATAISTPRIAPGDRLGWRWWTRYGDSAPVSPADAGP